MSHTAGLVDFHCHLDLYEDHAAAIQAAEEAGVYTLAVTTTPRAWPRNYELTHKTKHVRAALGLHPQLAHTHGNEIALWDRHLSETRYIGEVGLDAGPRFYRHFDIQTRIFQHILEKCALAGNKIVTIHSVRSAKIVLDYIEKFCPNTNCKFVLHWFTGTKSEALRAVDLGCYFSINLEMMKNDKSTSLLHSIPRERMLTETDGPFTRIHERPSLPTDVQLVVEKMSSLFQIDPHTLKESIKKNLHTLVSER